MKKKVLIILAAFSLLIGITTLLALYNLPALVSFALSRTTGLAVSVEETDVSVNDGMVNVRLGNMTVKGSVSGRFRHVGVMVFLYPSIFIERLTVRDFDLVLGEAEVRAGKLLTPIKLLEINNGNVTAQGRKLFIESVFAENINTRKPLLFMASIVDPDHNGSILLSGGSSIENKKHHIRGSLAVTSFGLEKFHSILKGTVKGTGQFTYDAGVLTIQGECETPMLTINDTWLKKELAVQGVTAKATIISQGNDVEIIIDDTVFRDAPFSINVKMKSYAFSRLEVTSGFIPMKDVREYLLLEDIGYDVWEYIRDGSLKIRKITYNHDGPFRAEIVLKDLTASYEDKHFSSIEGILYIKDGTGVFSEGKGAFGASTFYNLGGTIQFGEKASIRGTGKYSVDLTHIKEFVEIKGLSVIKGTAEGMVEMESVKGKDARFGGTGRIQNTEALWKQHPFRVNGAFKLSGQEILFDPLIAAGKETNLVFVGKLGPKGMEATVKGHIGAKLISEIVEKSLKASGKMEIEGQLEFGNGELRGSGKLVMDELAYEFQRYFKKASGIKSAARVRFTKKKVGDIVVDDFAGNLDVVNVKARGIVSHDRRIDGHITASANDVGRVAPMFHLNEDITGGDLSVDVTINDLSFPVVKLPFIVGSLNLRKGFFKLPGMEKVFGNIDLISNFKGREFDVTVNGLTCGKSILRKAVVNVKGLEAPRFNIVVDMDRLDTADLKSTREFRVNSIGQESLLARAAGNLSLRSKDLNIKDVQGRDLEINAFMVDRKINVSDLKLRIFEGETNVKGMIDLSRAVPDLYIDGKMSRVHTGFFFQAFGGTSQEITGSTYLVGGLHTAGTTQKDLITGLNGEVSIYSKDGVIKRWKLLSKIFALLNVYDLVKGKIDLGKDGLAYGKMGATFSINRGVFHTDNFLLDSPSMVITGIGNLDANEKTIDGTLAVSPLVALDRTIDKIPILRNILKDKDKGFLYVKYKVKGSFDDPDVATDFVGAVGSRSLEILRNIITFPKEVFER